MVCVDTDFLVAFSRKDRDATSKFEEMLHNTPNLCVTPISCMEMFEGAFKSKNDEKKKKTREILSMFTILEFDMESSEESGRLLNYLQGEGTKIGDMDTIIGAIALRHGETILTRNGRHFEKIPGLKVEKW